MICITPMDDDLDNLPNLVLRIASRVSGIVDWTAHHEGIMPEKVEKGKGLRGYYYQCDEQDSWRVYSGVLHLSIERRGALPGWEHHRERQLVALLEVLLVFDSSRHRPNQVRAWKSRNRLGCGISSWQSRWWACWSPQSAAVDLAGLFPA